MNSTPQSASSRVGGCRIAPDIAAWPRGSRISSSRRSSISASKCSLRSSIVAPGIGSTPAVTTRVGIPSVCESTASILIPAATAIASQQRGALVVGERQSRRARRTADEADLVHRRLEVLHELGRHVEAGEREQAAVDRARGLEVAGAAGVVELHALARQHVGDAGHPAGRAGAEALERPVVAADEDLQARRRVEQRGDPPRVARALLDRHDAVDLLVQADDQVRRHVDAARLRVVVGHQRQPGGLGDGAVVRDRLVGVGPVAERRQHHQRARAGLGGVGGQARSPPPECRPRCPRSPARGPRPRARPPRPPCAARRSLMLPASPIVPVATMPWTPASSSAARLDSRPATSIVTVGGRTGW